MKTSANHSLVAVVLAAKAVETIPDTLPLIPDTLVAVVLAAKAVETQKLHLYPFLFLSQ